MEGWEMTGKSGENLRDGGDTDEGQCPAASSRQLSHKGR